MHPPKLRSEQQGAEAKDKREVIIEKSRGEVSPMGQDTIENVS